MQILHADDLDSPDFDPMDTQPIPQAPGPEKSVLALMAADPATYMGKAVTAGVNEDYFYFPAHRTVWRIFLECFERNNPLDIVSVAQVLGDRNLLTGVGGLPALAEIYSYTTTGAFFDYHLEILRGKYILRSIIRTAEDFAAQAYRTGDDEVPGLLDSAEAAFFNIREHSSREGEKTLAGIIDEAVDRLEEMIANKGKISGLASGFETLDAMTGGLKPGDMFVIAARPSMGKTSFLLNMAEYMALDLKKKTLLFSCEMPSAQLVERILFARAKVQRASLLQSGGLTRHQMQSFKTVVGELKDAPLVLDDTPAISINELRARARRVMRDLGGLDVIGIDYLQLMRSHTKQAQNSREREIAEISAGLKALAKELRVPIVVLAQLNRGPENRTGKSKGVPQMSDLRESGAIEQDADMIGLLYRSAYYADDEDERRKQGGRANLYLAKNRNGPTGDVSLTFTPELMRFSSRTRDDQDPD